MKVTLFGIGYVGLVQAAVLADAGHSVCCVDLDREKIERLLQGHIPIYEPGLAALVKKNYAEGRLQFTADAKQGVDFGDILFIAVGTPPNEDGSAELKHVLKVASSIAEYMTSSKVIVNKSTVPVGTAARVSTVVAQKLESRGLQLWYAVVSNPEFLKEGAAVNDCKRPDRIIVGTDCKKAEVKMRELYAPFNRNRDRVIVMDVRSAEMTKYAANCMLATKISFMNELANIAECVGADIEMVRQGIGSDLRIGYHFIYPGCGYGGSCFPKDVQALKRIADENGCRSEILEAVEAVNQRQKQKLIEYICHYYRLTKEYQQGTIRGILSGKTFAVWGLAFKPDTDDMREASSRQLMEALWLAGARVQAYDPKAMGEAQRIYGKRDDFALASSKEEALDGANALIICTEWQCFRAPDLDLINSSLIEPVIFDGRNMFEPDHLMEKGFSYYAIGRGLSVTHPLLNDYPKSHR